MLTNREILERVKERYDVFELIEDLGLEEIAEDCYDVEMADFVKTFRNIIIKKAEELDIW